MQEVRNGTRRQARQPRLRERFIFYAVKSPAIGDTALLSSSPAGSNKRL